jgi:hypothetical protein
MCVDTLTSLLRAEQSAVASYHHALARFAGRTAAPRLRRLCVDHSRAVQLLHGMLLRDDALAPPERADSPVGPAGEELEPPALLRSLRGREALLVEQYRGALADARLSSAARALLRCDLLRRCEAHVPVLDALCDAAEAPLAGSPAERGCPPA